MAQWYFYVDSKLTGPVSDDMAKSMAKENQGAYCWREGYPEWRPVFQAPEIWPVKKDGVTPYPAPSPEMMSAKPTQLPVVQTSAMQTTSAIRDESFSHFAESASPRAASSHSDASAGYGQSLVTEGIDFRIYGHEMQFVEVELDPGESAIAEAGVMMYKSAGVDMQTVFGSGDDRQQSVLDRLIGAGKRLLTNASLFITVFTQTAGGKGRVAFSSPFPGTIIPIKLSDYGGALICQKDSFLCSAKGVQIGIYFQRRILTGLFGGDGFIMQKLEGDGWVFIHLGGTLHKVELAPGEVFHVDTGCLAAMTSTVDFDIQQVGGIRSMLFGGEGVFFARLMGPGTIWLQSLPFSRLAGRMLAAAPQRGGGGGGDMNMLDGLNNLFKGY